jgi:hypothetical protein
MATVTTSATNTGGLKQDLLNLLTTIQETKTVFVSRLKASVAHQRVHLMPSDRVKLPTTVAAVSAVEGAAFSPIQVDDFTQATNNCQIIPYPFTISGTMEASDYAGIASTVAYQKEKGLKYIGVALEMSLVQGVLTNESGVTGRQMQGINSWATTNIAYSGASATITTGNIVAAGEASFNAVCQALATKGIEPNFAYMSHSNKTLVDQWTGKVVRYIDQTNGEGRLPVRLAVYEGSFGDIELIHTTAQVFSQITIGDMDKLRIAYLRKPFVKIMGDTYDGWSFQVLAEATLEILDPYSLGYMTVTNS